MTSSTMPITILFHYDQMTPLRYILNNQCEFSEGNNPSQKSHNFQVVEMVQEGLEHVFVRKNRK